MVYIFPFYYYYYYYFYVSYFPSKVLDAVFLKSYRHSSNGHFEPKNIMHLIDFHANFEINRSIPMIHSIIFISLFSNFRY